ncbi:MAG: transglycosylase SLT domain-containing protein, partial [Cyanobacteria bacterium P01_H01_bin.26]
FNPNVPPEFQAKVNEMAGRLGMNPDYLMAVMGFETGGTFDPSIRNAAGSGATGLIQFMPSTARGLGTSTGALAGMSQLDQLDYVEQYLSPYAGQLNSLEDTYMSVLYPAAIGRGAGHTLFNQGTTAYRQNSGLDINEDGRITVGEATNKVREYLPAGGESGQATRARNNIAYAPSFTYTPSARPASGNIALNITVNVSGASGNARQEAYEGTVAAVDEFEREWRAGTDRSQPDSSDDYSYS